MTELQRIIDQMEQATWMGLSSAELAEVIRRLSADAEWELEKMKKPEVGHHE